MAEARLPHPFLKWAGGKGQLLGELLRHVPPIFRTYYEPFLGSGALFFGLYRSNLISRAVLSDSNAELVDAYLIIRDNVGPLIALLHSYPHDRGFYYTLRSQEPCKLDPVSRAARMIYLNKTGYNGLYRVNRQGKFNVPFGRYKSPKICDEPNLHAISEALQGIQIVCAPFEIVRDQACAGDLVYFDPPYAPLSPTAHFTDYQPGGFGREDQLRLRDLCLELAGRGVCVLLSNSDTELIRELYGSPPFAMTEVQASRAINCVAGKRGRITELIITTHASGTALRLS